MTTENEQDRQSPRSHRQGSLTMSGSPENVGGEERKQLSACLARYMDFKAFTAKKVGKEQAEKLKARREIATKRARAAIRFFCKPENLERLNRHAALLAARGDKL